MDRRRVRVREQAAARSKFSTYLMLNPSLEVHQMYSDCDVVEYQRVAVTRLRLSSHNLAIERGRWSRLPREARLCECGQVQDECHVLLHCPQNQATRQQLADGLSLENVMKHENCVHIIYSLMKDFL